MNQMISYEVVADGLRFPEGPIALPDGSFLVVEIAGKALTHIADKGKKSVLAELDGGPNGAAIGPDGRCYICNSGGWKYKRKKGLTLPCGQSMTAGWIERVCLSTGEVERLYDDVNGVPLSAPNDIVFDDQGGFWFTDHGKRRDNFLEIAGVYYAAADGSSLELAIDGLLTPNGIGLSPDGKTLYVAETRTARLWSWGLSGPGQIERKSTNGHIPHGGSLIATMPGFYPLDSMSVDSGGQICVASLIHGGIWAVNPDSGEMKQFPLPDPYTTNICFGGKGLATAYVTLSASGKLISFPWQRPGLKLNYN